MLIPSIKFMYSLLLSSVEIYDHLIIPELFTTAFYCFFDVFVAPNTTRHVILFKPLILPPSESFLFQV